MSFITKTKKRVLSKGKGKLVTEPETSPNDVYDTNETRVVIPPEPTEDEGVDDMFYPAQYVKFTFTIEIKDNRVRVTFDNMHSPVQPYFGTASSDSTYLATDSYDAVRHAMFVKEAEGVVASLEAAFLNADLDW